MKKVFLAAEWNKLIMANYAVDPWLLAPYLPLKTEHDLRDGTCYVSLVGFMFSEVRLKGLRIPFHTTFEEVNLRFYIRFKDKNEWKRGTVFISEIVPRYAIALVANTIYGESYQARRMAHLISGEEGVQTVEYHWKQKTWNTLQIQAGTQSFDMPEGSEEAFIAEHYWGCSKGKRNTTLKYAVEHPAWQVYKTLGYSVDVNFAANYGERFGLLQQLMPSSIFLVEGSKVFVRNAEVLR